MLGATSTSEEYSRIRVLVVLVTTSLLIMGAFLDSLMGPASLLGIVWALLVLSIAAALDVYERLRTRRLIVAYSDECLLEAWGARDAYTRPLRSLFFGLVAAAWIARSYGTERCLDSPRLDYVTSLAGAMLALMVALGAPDRVRWAGVALTFSSISFVPLCSRGVYHEWLPWAVVRPAVVMACGAALIDGDTRLWQRSRQELRPLQVALALESSVERECVRVLVEAGWLIYAHPLFMVLAGAVLVAERRQRRINAIERSMAALEQV